MITRRMFLSDTFVALAAAGCSTSEPVPGKGSVVPARREAAPVGRGASDRKLLKLTTNHAPNLCQVATRVARERGFFATEGLEVTLLPFDVAPGHNHAAPWVVGPNGPEQADIMVMEFPTLVEIALGKIDYRVVAGEHSGCKQLVVPSGSAIRTLADLKGKRIGLPASQDTLMWNYLMQQAGVNPGSVQWVLASVPIGASEELAFVKQQFATGRLDAYVSVDPTGEILKRDGIARLLASNTWTPPLNGWYCCMIAVSVKVLDAHPEVAGAVARAYRRATAFVQQNPAEAVKLSVDAGYIPADTPQDIDARLLGEYVWTGTGRIEEDLERYFQLLIEAGRLPTSPSPRELVQRVYRSGDL